MRINFRKLDKRYFIFIFVICLSMVFTVSADACRMWGMVSDTLQPEILQEHLMNFRAFGSSNPTGWAIGYFFNGITQYPLTWPIVRRGGPPADIDPDYNLAVTEAIQQKARTVLAHVRIATSGHSGVPNPHPFMEPGWMFCHNGTIDRNTLINLITQSYLNQHQPDYTNPNIDSELYFIYLMKTIKEMTNGTPFVSIEDAISHAVSTLDSALNQNGYSSQLTFLLTDGKKLWGCRYADTNPTYYTLYYNWPTPGNNWAVASQPVSGGTWTPITMYHLMTFEPGMRLVDVEIPHK